MRVKIYSKHVFQKAQILYNLLNCISYYFYLKVSQVNPAFECPRIYLALQAHTDFLIISSLERPHHFFFPTGPTQLYFS